ncbi:hypothetical protein AMECASPLE_008353, partial [Ameca splendens]
FKYVFPLIRHWWWIGGQGARKPGIRMLIGRPGDAPKSHWKVEVVKNCAALRVPT